MPSISRRWPRWRSGWAVGSRPARSGSWSRPGIRRTPTPARAGPTRLPCRAAPRDPGQSRAGPGGRPATPLRVSADAIRADRPGRGPIPQFEDRAAAAGSGRLRPG